MALNSLNKSFLYLLIRKFSKYFMCSDVASLPIIRNTLNDKSEIILLQTHNPFKKILKFFHADAMLKSASTYENLVNQSLTQTKFCTKSEKCSDKPPLGRHQFHKETEDIINQQISAEFHAAFSYLSIACYFGRTEVALPGCQGFFLNMYEEELEHAMVFVNYMLMRGGHILLTSIEPVEIQDWKSISNAFTQALEMEKTVKEKLIAVYDVAEEHKDLQVMDIVSTQFMEEQNNSICKLARLLTRAKMTENAVGEYLFDKMIFNSFVKESKNNQMYKRKLEDNPEDNIYK